MSKRLTIGIASGDRIPLRMAKDGQVHWGGAGWVRLAQYIPYLEQEFDVATGTLMWYKDRFCIDPTDGEHDFHDVDIVYMQRLMHDSLADHIKMAQKIGQIIINDLDDWYWGLSTSNGAYLSSHPKNNPTENVNHYKSVLNASNCVTISTPYLASRASKFVHCPIEIIPNTVDVNRFVPRVHTDTNTPIVGWVGSTGHRSNDLEQMFGILKPMFKNGDIKLQHSGYHEGGKTFADSVGLSDEDIITIPACDPEVYPMLFTMDVGIAPLNDMPFNHAKSDIKLLEYSAAGIPWIGSDLSAYRQLTEAWGIGRVAKKPQHWIKHLQALRNPDTRQSEGAALREAVKSRDIAIGAKTLADFIKSLL